MWLNLDLRLEDAKRVALGQQVRFWPDGGQEATGNITWISTEADHKTRTVKVRAALQNGDGRLRANTFGTGKVILHDQSQAVVVPSTAVQWEGCCHVVFVRDKDFFREGAPKVFHVRTVRLGAKDEKQTGDRCRAAAGRSGGDQGQFLAAGRAAERQPGRRMCLLQEVNSRCDASRQNLPSTCGRGEGGEGQAVLPLMPSP